ncbi:MAG: serine/threonine protein kinase [Planctomycetes bacterium]|nr:serine/threonine protein kinase [Planctomycetota bacterium]
MAATAPPSSAELLDLLRRSNILPADRLKLLPNVAALPPEPARAAALLVQKGFVTKFQATQLLAGRHKGFRIGPYVIQDMLGRGGMGAVYLGEHLELHRKVAIKILAPGKGEDHKLALERFLREARAAAALDHPNIVRLHDIARHNDNTSYLVMEYVEGHTLQQLVDRDGPMPPDVAAECVAQAASGLQHAHERGFVHRDIKPANLIRDRFGAIKILDMGLARSGSDRDKLTEVLDEGAVVGTADYISPEQAINCPTVDARADIYSLGATLFTMVVGKTPFEGNTTQKLMQHQLRAAPPLRELNPDVPEELARVVAKMLAKKPIDRYQSAAEVIEALAPWAASSARVIAGLSQTSLGAVNSRTALQGRAVNSSRRLLGSARPSDADIDPTNGGKPTGVLSAEDTLRDPAVSPPGDSSAFDPETNAPHPRRRWLLFAGVGVAALIVTALGAWLAFGRDKPQEPAPGVGGAPAPGSTPAPPARPAPKQPAVAPPASPKPPSEKVVYRLDLAAQEPFVTRSGLTADPTDPNKRNYRLVAQTGSGALPAGWTARCWNTDSEMEAFAETGASGPAIGIRNASGPASAVLFGPRFDSPSGFVRLRIEYAANVRDKAFLVRFKPNDQRAAWDVTRPPAGGEGWRTEDLLVDLKGAGGGCFEFHSGDALPGNVVRLRAVSAAEPTAASPDRVVFKLDAYDLPGFKNTKTGRTKTGGEDEPMIAGVSFAAWKPETESEWVCGPVAGAKAIGITNLNDAVSAQIGVELEGAAGLKFAPGQIVRVRVTYRTSGKGHGSVYVQNADDKTAPDRAGLPSSNSDWKVVELVTTRGASPLRCLIDTGEKGAGNTLFVRSVTVAEVGPPRPAPKTDPALDPATWSEGAALYSLNVSAVPAFRVQKEKGQRVSGDAEKLPAGVGCHCWKDGAMGEFRCDTFDGVPALGVTNLNDEKSGQYSFAFEGGMKLPLQPGKGYRVKVGYRTANDAAGAATVHVVPGYKGIGTAKLTNTAVRWKVAVVSFVRPPAEDKVDVRMVIDNNSVGEGNTVWVRSLEVVELTPPAKK